MKTIKYPIVLLFALLLSNAGVAQNKTYDHGVFWARVVLADKINAKTKWELFLQKRTQNLEPGAPNIFASTHYTSVWFWLNFTLNKNFKLSVSPFGYFNNHGFNRVAEDAALPGIKEYRYSVRLENEQKYPFLNFNNRYSFELRTRDLLRNNVYQINYRFRYQARLEKPIKGIFSKTKPVTFFLADEIFLQFGPAVKNTPNVFDQNRFNIGASYEPIKNVKLAVSYVNFIQERNSGKEFDNADVLWVVLTFDNLFSQFKKKEVKPAEGVK
jgi:hypothetical protein